MENPVLSLLNSINWVQVRPPARSRLSRVTVPLHTRHIWENRNALQIVPIAPLARIVSSPSQEYLWRTLQ